MRIYEVIVGAERDSHLFASINHGHAAVHVLHDLDG